MEMLATPADQEQGWNRHELRVPRADATLLAVPALTDAVGLVPRNSLKLQAAEANIQGRTLQQMRQWARGQVLAAAAEYTSLIAGENVVAERADYIVAAGHQPSLFHPGVWVKNFAVGEMAVRTGGTAVNLVIDNDIMAAPRVRVPSGNRERPAHEWLTFDSPRPRGPWEEAGILDREMFRAFGPTVVERMHAWGIKPLAESIWPDAVAMMEQTGMLRDALTACRSRVERRWGLSNLELPISRLCSMDSFFWFASHLFAQLPKFRGIYNEALYEYRELNRVRSRTHPVPDLIEKDGWIEAPFWIWRAGDSQRNRVFAKQVHREVHLTDGRETVARFPLTPDMDACCAVEELRRLTAQGLRLRTRALTTTLFARLFFADMFVHGIGGSKYDEMTDWIISRFYKLPAPEFLTLTATLYLPLSEPHNVNSLDESRLRERLRDLEWNPDRYITPGEDATVDRLIAEKRALIGEEHADTATELSRSDRRKRSRTKLERYRRLRDINAQLAARVADQRVRLEQERETVGAELAANSVLKDREYSFCLFPEEKIRPFMTGLLER